jgi:PAS domain S-box-containing protein
MSDNLRILLVEDSEDDAAFITRALRRGGYEPQVLRVDTAEDMAHALSREAWDVILSDYDLPAFGGQEALDLRNERCPDLPFIIVSGRIGEEAIVSAMRSGAQDYVLKRDLSRLVTAVDRALREMAAQQQKREAEAALRESEERYALAVRGSSDGIWDWNVTTNHVYYSPRFREMLGASEQELEPTLAAFNGRLHPDEATAIEAALHAHLTSRAPFDVECRVSTQQGEHRWFSWRGQALWNDSGEVTRMAGSLTDLTDRRRVEDELREKLQIIERQLEVIQRQQEEIRVLRTPIIQVWDGVLLTPVLGVLDRDRTAATMELLLDAVVRTQSRYVILDLTAVESIDMATVEHVVRLVRAVELLGGVGIVVGIRPSVAATIVDATLDLPRIKTLANLRTALLFCMERRAREQARRVAPAAQ